MRYHERMVMLSVIDGLWKDHLLAMDHLKEGIGLRGYAQQDPLVAYKKESFDMFEAMMAKFQEDTVRFLFRMQILGPDGRPIEMRRPNRAERCRLLRRLPAPTNYRSTVTVSPVCSTLHRARSPSPRVRRPRRSISWRRNSTAKSSANSKLLRAPGGGNGSQPSQRRTGEKVGRNDPCPCGSGKKYKKCHGTEA